MGQRILAFCDSDGNRFNLLDDNGLSVKEWRPKRPDVNASFREVPGIDGRLPSSWKFGQVSETLEHNAKAQTADDLIELFQDMYRLLILGLNYHTVNWQATRVWVECKAENETNTRYALISLFQPGDDDFPFRDPFLPKTGYPSATDTGLIIERGHWCALPPGTGECVEISSVQNWEYSTGNFVDMGVEDDCDGEVYIANKSVMRNLTHIKIFDASGASYENIFPITSFPQRLFPASPAINDAIYFGISTSISNLSAFSSLIFDIGTGATGGFSLVKEYWNGAAWISLPFITTTTSLFIATGLFSVHWLAPANWEPVAVDGVTAYWIRVRISAFTSMPTLPTQVNRQIYTVIQPFLEVNEEEVGGDLSALARYKMINQADIRGASFSLPVNRVVCGLRSTHRGDNFNAYINFSQAQPLSELLVSASVFGSFVDNVQAPMGQCIEFDMDAADNQFEQGAVITFSSDNVESTDWHGRYHLYLRGFQSNGSPGDIQVRAKITSFSGGTPFYSNPTSFKQTTLPWEVLDLDAVTLGSDDLGEGEAGDNFSIVIQAKNTSGVSNRMAQIYDIILIPTDEWMGDFSDPTDDFDSANPLTDFSGIGGSTTGLQYLDVDSLTIPKKVGRSVVKISLDDRVSSIYEFAANGEVMLQNNVTQRLWVFAMQQREDAWHAYPETAWSIQAFKNQRYLAARGSR